MAIVLVVVMVQFSSPPLLIGIASALLISVRSLGGTVGYAIAEAIYSSKTNTQIPEAISASRRNLILHSRVATDFA